MSTDRSDGRGAVFAELEAGVMVLCSPPEAMDGRRARRSGGGGGGAVFAELEAGVMVLCSPP
ncbi:hypothetical protein [Kribbella antiqua]|uniref:hypothetical protein n=1 Tax=Kribbella antiqua TaxID=2512217 RepID=UPI001048A0D0|nr:hypothetical protein [Kribbella antiqua]